MISRVGLIKLLCVAVATFGLACAASAATVTVTFSGTLDFSTIPEYAVDTPFSGSIVYSTDVPLASGGPNYSVWRPLSVGALTINIAGDSVSSTNADPIFTDYLQVMAGGTLEFASRSMAGNGPANGGLAFIFFEGSEDPLFPALGFPYPFPTDFTSATITLLTRISGREVRGTITSFDAEDVSATPLPATPPLFASGLGVLGLLAYRRKRDAAKPIRR